MIISTTNTIENRKIKKYLGIVSGTDIYLVGGLFGGGLANQENLYSQALSTAISRMESKAAILKANAIVGVSTNIVSPGNLNNIIVIATGTAVITEVINPDEKKEDSSEIDLDNFEDQVICEETVEKQERILNDEEILLLKKLNYALQYQTDDGMISCLEKIDNEIVKTILTSPKNSIREQIIDLVDKIKYN